MKTATESPVSESAPTVAAPRDSVSIPASSRFVGEPFEAQGLRLKTQYFLSAALLVVVTLGLAVALATWRANLIAEESIRTALKKIPGDVAVYRTGLESQLKATLRSVAEEPGIKAIFDSPVGTLWDTAKDKAEILNARTFFFFDRAGVLVARSDRPPAESERRSFREVAWVAEPLDSWKESAATIREGKTLAVVAAAPVVAGDPEKGEARIVGVVAASIPLDDSRARELRDLTGGQVAFVADMAKKGAPPKLEIGAATDHFGGDMLVPALNGDPAVLSTLFREATNVGPLDLVVSGERRVVKAIPLLSASGEAIGAVVVSRSREEETAAFRQIRETLLLVGLGALLVSIPVSFLLAGRIARPLQQLAAGAIAVRDGNLDVQLPSGGSGEVGLLARAFEALVGELREKRQLEELLAELRRRPADATHGALSPSATAATVTAGAARGAAPGPRLGATFAGRYDVLSVLGQGGMGAVYQVLDRELDEEVALKVLTPEAFAEGTQAVQTLKQEIRLARKITHPNVVRTHDLGEADGLRFLTMEFVPGTTLRELLDRTGPVALAPGLQIAKQLCRGLTAVHEAGILHRDIKPQNIMVLPNGVVKLMDFGIARTDDGSDHTSADGETVGTPYYMSPEQVMGRALDARSDLYTVGVVLFELFTGRRPFLGKEAAEVMRMHISAEPPRPSILRADIPENLERIVLACLAKRPERRIASAADLYAALTRVAA
ncbi:MAG: protein kinase [Holophagales bacterium]|nr:protein kinase [Holophagales bacterium]MBK9965640.1 protein kinase [Holophagales bacterium]